MVWKLPEASNLISDAPVQNLQPFQCQKPQLFVYVLRMLIPNKSIPKTSSSGDSGATSAKLRAKKVEFQHFQLSNLGFLNSEGSRSFQKRLTSFQMLRCEIFSFFSAKNLKNLKFGRFQMLKVAISVKFQAENSIFGRFQLKTSSLDGFRSII